MDMADQQFDCVVIGSGPGGYVAAIRAAQLGMKTAVVEKDVVGGRCLNYACIPAKAVLRTADVLTEVRGAGDFGISLNGTEPAIDFDAVMARRARVIKTLTGGVAGLFKKNAIEYVEGFGSLTADGRSSGRRATSCTNRRERSPSSRAPASPGRTSQDSPLPSRLTP